MRSLVENVLAQVAAKQHPGGELGESR
jgi:hypothetical protein